jgi:2-polyprenyl-3-methyl-5-hydroxy-6-metoxy-1,4-benzoquinol methylase
MGLLKERSVEPEIMDQPDLSPRRHEQALVGLNRINFLSATARSFIRPLVAFQREIGAPSLRILDVACGGGDVTRRLGRAARSRGLDWQLAGCDLSPVAIGHARREAARLGIKVDYFLHDALSGPAPGPYDAIICSLFLHHLDNDRAVRLLEQMRQTRGVRLVLVNDLNRSLPGLFLAHVACRALSRSDVVHNDGPLSVRAAFTPEEAKGIARGAGLTGYTIRRRWPCRWFLSWRAP